MSRRPRSANIPSSSHCRYKTAPERSCTLNPPCSATLEIVVSIVFCISRSSFSLASVAGCSKSDFRVPQVVPRTANDDGEQSISSCITLRGSWQKVRISTLPCVIFCFFLGTVSIAVNSVSESQNKKKKGEKWKSEGLHCTQKQKKQTKKKDQNYQIKR